MSCNKYYTLYYASLSLSPRLPSQSLPPPLSFFMKILSFQVDCKHFKVEESYAFLYFPHCLIHYFAQYVFNKSLLTDWYLNTSERMITSFPHSTNQCTWWDLSYCMWVLRVLEQETVLLFGCLMSFVLTL